MGKKDQEMKEKEPSSSSEAEDSSSEEETVQPKKSPKPAAKKKDSDEEVKPKKKSSTKDKEEASPKKEKKKTVQMEESKPKSNSKTVKKKSEVNITTSKFKSDDLNEDGSQKLKQPKSWSEEHIGDTMTVARAVGAEFIATCLFVYIGVGSAVTSGSVDPELNGGRIMAISAAFGFAIVSLVYATAHLSGGHINPAVTIAVVATRSMPILKGVFYIIAQICGGIFGAGLLHGSVPEAFRGTLGSNGLAPGVSAGNGFLMEFMLTFLLVFVVFSTAVDPASDSPAGRQGNFAPLAIGWAVMLAHLVAIPFTGCGINPARSFASSVIGDFWEDHWIFWVAPILGGLAGACVYQLLFMGLKSFRKTWN